MFDQTFAKLFLSMIHIPLKPFYTGVYMKKLCIQLNSMCTWTGCMQRGSGSDTRLQVIVVMWLRCAVTQEVPFLQTVSGLHTACVILGQGSAPLLVERAEGQVRVQRIRPIHPQPMTGQEMEACPHLRKGNDQWTSIDIKRYCIKRAGLQNCNN